VQEPQPSQIALELVHASALDRGRIIEATPSSNEPTAQRIEAKHESDMSTPTPLIIEPGSHSMENEHKSVTKTYVLSDDLSAPGYSHNRHESNREPVPPSGQQKPESIFQDTPQRQDQPPTASETAQRQNIRESRSTRSSQDLEQGIVPFGPWISRPRMTIIDIDDRGLRTRTWQGWAGGPETERPGLGTANSSTRITLVERKCVKKEEGKNKKGLKDKMKAVVEIDLAASETETEEEEHYRRKFCMRDLQALLSTEKTGPSFLLQTNCTILEAAFSWSDLMHNEDYLIPLPSEARHIGFNYRFWELYTKLVFNFSDDLGVEGV